VELEQSALLRGLSADVLAELKQLATVRDHLGNEIILREGDPAKEVFVVRDGKVLLTCGLPRDPTTRVHVAQLDPGESFGWAALLGHETATAEARALDDSSVYALPARELGMLLSRHSEAGLEVMTRLAGSLLTRLLRTRKDLRWVPGVPQP
jgi:CRP-like cAMP-binding protein